RISGTLIRLANMRASRKVTDTPRDLATYGLDAPRDALTLQDPNGVDYTLLIGGKTPNDGGYYAKTPDSETIWLVGTLNIEDRGAAAGLLQQSHVGSGGDRPRYGRQAVLADLDVEPAQHEQARRDQHHRRAGRDVEIVAEVHSHGAAEPAQQRGQKHHAPEA